MVTFDSNQVQTYARSVHAKLDQCADGEGMICEGLDKKLTYFADRCWEFSQEIRHWANDIFAGRVGYDPVAEQFWIAELQRLLERAEKEWVSGAQAETDCFLLDGRAKLGAALWTLSELMNPWVSPRLAVGPAARRKLSIDTSSDEFKSRIASLKPRPKDWMPRDKEQAARYKAIRGR